HPTPCRSGLAQGLSYIKSLSAAFGYPAGVHCANGVPYAPEPAQITHTPRPFLTARWTLSIGAGQNDSDQPSAWPVTRRAAGVLPLTQPTSRRHCPQHTHASQTAGSRSPAEPTVRRSNGRRRV